MAQQENSNSFALLVDDDVDDVSTFLDRVAEKVKISLEAEENNKQNQKQQPSRRLQSSGAGKGERWRGRGDQRHGRFGYGRNEVEQFGNGHANRYEQNHRGSDGHHRTNREGNERGGSDSYQRYNGGVDSYRRNYGGEDGYRRNYGGEDGYRRNYGGMNGSQRNYMGDSTQNAGNHNGNDRGRGSGSDENNASGYEVEAIDSQQNTIQDVANGSGQEQLNEFQGKVRGSESFKDDVRLFNNGNQNYGSNRRGYGGENSNFRGREGHSYGGRSGRNTRGELSNNSETKEGLDGEKEHAPSGDNSGKAKRNPLLSAEVEKDTEPKQGKYETENSSDNAREEEENKMTLEEYEKQLVEKRKALEAMKNSVERKVIVDKDFESMQLVEKKKEDSIFIKLNSEEPKKKDILDKEEKVRKLVSINEFLKPSNGEMPMRRGGRGRGRGEQGGFRGSFPRQQGRGNDTPALGDPRQFPILGGAVKA